MGAEQSRSAERRRRNKQRSEVSQYSFVMTAEDAGKLLLLRRFVADLSAIYETGNGKSLEEAITIRSPADAYDFLKGEMEHLEQKQMRVLNLNTRNVIVSTEMIYQGNINSIIVRPAEIFRPAIMDNSCALIVVHNHPSGDPSPSPEDVKITSELVQAGKLLGIDVLDHLVVGRGGFVSLKERGLGFEG